MVTTDFKTSKPFDSDLVDDRNCYCIVKASLDDMHEFTHEVESLIHDGYKTIGGISVDGDYIYQAMGVDEEIVWEADKDRHQTYINPEKRSSN